MHHIVIGAGPAGVVAAEALRKFDPGATITLIGEEPEPPYSRMAIPYMLIGKIGEAGTYLRKREGHFEKQGIEVLRNRVGSVDPASHSISLDSGASMRYDRLLLATGSRPLTPPVPGIDSDRVYQCWTLADARKISALAKPGNKVVLIGAGFIGSIILEALFKSGVELHVVEMGNRMVPRMLDETAGNLLKRWCEEKGIFVHTSARVDSIQPQGQKLDVVLNNGSGLQADMVISATGVTPNVEFLQGSGIAIDQGVQVDEFLRSNFDDIYAAGDVAQAKDFSTGGFRLQAIQPTAVDHAQIATRNMIKGHHYPHRGNINMNVLDTMGLISSSFAQWMGVAGGESTSLVDKDGYRYLNLQFQDDVLIGASSLGLTEHVGALRGLIQSRTRLGSWKARLMKDPTRFMEAYISSTQAIGHNAYVL
jgi:NAD(P)H-nitrite reductase large subunit